MLAESETPAPKTSLQIAYCGTTEVVPSPIRTSPNYAFFWCFIGARLQPEESIQLYFNFLGGPVELYDAEAADLAGAGGFGFGSRAGAGFPAILQHRAQRR